MPFPDSQRVVYNKNPLEEVICQLRFPPILRIDAQVPADFQDGIREDYPLFDEIRGADIDQGLPPEVKKFFGPDPPFHMGMRQYQFMSADQKWGLVLTREFLSLSCSQYKRWEEFKQHLEIPLRTLVKQYKPTFYLRIGLRYRDVIKRSELGLDNVNWSELLKSHITGELSSPDVAGDIDHAAREVLIRLEGGHGQVLVKHGLVRNRQTDEKNFVIDCDFFTNKRTEVSNAVKELDYFNRQAGHLFRWCIQDQLHEAMAPQAI